MSKSDQDMQGAVRNHWRSGHPEVCPVLAVARFIQARLAAGVVRQTGKGFFRLNKDELPLTRGIIAAFMKDIAEQSHCPPEDYGTHSARHGGAALMWASGKSLDTIRRFGRWKSDAFMQYIWDPREETKDFSSGMVTIPEDARDEGPLRDCFNDARESAEAEYQAAIWQHQAALQHGS